MYPMEFWQPDASGRRRPQPVEGSEFIMEVDTVIMSLGTSPNPLISSTTKGLKINRKKCIVADEETGITSKAGVYAGGDAGDRGRLRLFLLWALGNQQQRVSMNICWRRNKTGEFILV